MSNEDQNQIDRVPSPDLAPQSPASAFSYFIELIRNSRYLLDVDPDVLLNLLRPFLANPNRDAPYVREIMQAYAAAFFYNIFQKTGFLKLFTWFGRGKMEQVAPNLISRLRELEDQFRKGLQPGSINLYLKPVRYLETPDGFGAQVFYRYQIQVQTLIESTPDDSLHTVTVEITTNSKSTESVIDNLSPHAGFTTVGIKRTAGLQVGQQQTLSDKEAAGVEISGGGAKLSSGIESVSTEQTSASLTVGGEKTSARVEQYLIARKIGNRAIWQTLSGVGPIDAAGTEYSIEVLVPSNCKELEIHIDARVEWINAGVVPVHLQKTIALPIPKIESKIISN